MREVVVMDNNESKCVPPVEEEYNNEKMWDIDGDELFQIPESEIVPLVPEFEIDPPPVPEFIVPQLPQFSQSGTTFVQRGTTVEVYQHEVSYQCTFQLKPEMLKHFYNPGCESYYDGIQILPESPVFEGGFNTKWQIQLNIVNWLDPERWMSLYLTHLDDLSPPDLKVQCEFMIVDDKNNKLFSKGNILGIMQKGQTYGVQKFLLFKDVKSMLTSDNAIRINAHLTLVCHSDTSPISSVDLLNKNDVNSDTSELCEIQDISCFDFYLPGINYHFGINADDQVTVLFENEPVITLNRSLLKEKSQTYANCLNQWIGSKDEINFDCNIGEDKENQIRVLREYGFYIHHGYCKTLEIGTFQEMHHLLRFAKKMETEELASRCLTAMTMKLSSGNASVLAAAIVHFFKARIILDQDDMIMISFRKFFKENFNRIRRTEPFKRLMKKYIDNFVDFAFSPSV